MAFAAFGCLTLAAGVAQAASFDCAKARTPVERAICADPQLSELDGNMAQAYAKRRTGLDTKADKALVAAQKIWVEERDLSCPVPKDAEGDVLQKGIQCLTDLYFNRIAELHPDGATGKYTVRLVKSRPVCIHPDGFAVPFIPLGTIGEEARRLD